MLVQKQYLIRNVLHQQLISDLQNRMYVRTYNYKYVLHILRNVFEAFIN